MKLWIYLSLITAGLCGNCLADEESPENIDVLVVVGAGGEESYTKTFTEAANLWRQHCDEANLKCSVIGSTTSESNDREQLLAALGKWAQRDDNRRRWLVLIGHGTANRSALNFNLNGPDISDVELKQALDGVPAPTVVACCFSTSGAWFKSLSAKNRIVLTATTSATEANFSRFAQHLASSVNDKTVDLDHDDEVSLLEAFLAATRRTQLFYDDANRLATEHALLDDNGDGKGTSADFYDGLRVVGKTSDNSVIDGALAKRVVLKPNAQSQLLSDEQLQAREIIEADIEALRLAKAELDIDVYYERLESLLLRLHDIYEPR